MLERILNGSSMTAKLIRFGAVGGVSGLVYLVVTAGLTSYMGVDPRISSVIGYLASVPINYIGNRLFSFRSSERIAPEFARYAVVHLANIVLALTTMSVVTDVLQQNYIYGSIATIILIPIGTFLIMHFWVFRSQPYSEAFRPSGDNQ